MAPRIDGRVHRFAEHGLYDGLFLLRDEETGTYWDHMTGDAVYGPLVGGSLEVGNLLQTTVRQVLGHSPEALVALSDRSLRSDDQMALGGLLSGVGGRLSRLFRSTVDEEDDRRPTMDLGLGIWDGDASRYYPYDRVLSEGRALLDTFQGRTVLVYLDPAAFALGAVHVEADAFEWEGDVLHLSDGTTIAEGVLRGPDGTPKTMHRPLQVFTRWYGFSLTFPGTEIWGEAR
jgi:hypothetical protein